MLPPKKCFIITPIGPEGSVVRRSADGVIDAVILPLLEEMGFTCDVAHRIYESGSISKQAIARIINDDLVIANLTGLNPNVMYELGIRHSARKPVLHICQNGTNLPFDLAPERTLFYNDDMLGTTELRPRLKSFIEKAMEDTEPDNPVYQAVEKSSIMQTLNAEDPLNYIINRLDQLSEQISSKNDSSLKRKLIPSSPKRARMPVTHKSLKDESDIAAIVLDIAGKHGAKKAEVSFEIEKGQMYAVVEYAEVNNEYEFLHHVAQTISDQ
jgi:hypothetical protein